MIKKILCFTIASFVFFGNALLADDEVKFHQWVKSYKTTLKAKSNLPQSTIDKAFEKVIFLPKVIKRDRNQLHKKITFTRYRQWVVSEKRVKVGREKFAAHRPMLQKTGKKYGINPEVIVALWGIETFYGKIQGDFNIIDSFLTLIYDGRRGAFFEKELIHTLKMMDKQQLQKSTFKGSWAGAMGATQFMPSSYAHYAVDEDNDGKKDIWKNQQDIFASIANYLAKHGFNDAEPILQELKKSKKLTPHLEQKKSIKAWRALGVKSDLPDKVEATLRKFDDYYFLVFDNFEVIKRWNRSDFFALSVGLVAREVKK